MMKAFFRHNKIPIKSFHTEVLCVLATPTVVDSLLSVSHPAQMQYVLAVGLAQMANLLDYPVSIPGSYSLPVGLGLQYYELQNVKDNLKFLSEVAWRYCQMGEDKTVLGYWRQLMGHPFPVV